MTAWFSVISFCVCVCWNLHSAQKALCWLIGWGQELDDLQSNGEVGTLTLSPVQCLGWSWLVIPFLGTCFSPATVFCPWARHEACLGDHTADWSPGVVHRSGNSLPGPSVAKWDAIGHCWQRRGKARVGFNCHEGPNSQDSYLGATCRSYTWRP